jgi:four helix bundle protein
MKNPIVDKTFQFALGIIRYTEQISQQKHSPFTNQILRSGTSIGANVREAQMAESKKDFLHKMSISAKEGEETEYWLMLCEKSEYYPDPGTLLSECIEINKILNKIINTTKNNLNGPKLDQ